MLGQDNIANAIIANSEIPNAIIPNVKIPITYKQNAIILNAFWCFRSIIQQKTSRRY